MLRWATSGLSRLSGAGGSASLPMFCQATRPILNSKTAFKRHVGTYVLEIPSEKKLLQITDNVTGRVNGHFLTISRNQTNSDHVREADDMDRL